MSETNGNGKWALPEGWVLVKLSEVAKLIRGVTYDKASSSETPSEGMLPILRATNIQDENLVLESDLVYIPERYVTENQLLQKNDIVICMSSGSKHLVGKAARLTKEWVGSFGAFCAGVRFDPSLDSRYAAYFFGSQEYRNLIRDKSSGVNINNLRRGDIENLFFPVPPTSEQTRIADEIEKQFTRLDAAVAALKRAKANLARYKAAVLKAAVEGRLVPQDPNDEPAAALLARILAERRAQWEADNPKKRYVEPKRPEVAGLPELPVGWVWATVDEVADHRLGKMLDKEKNRGEVYPYLRNANVRWFTFDLSDLLTMRVQEHELNNVSVRRGDLVVCEGGEPGRSAVWEKDETAIIQKALHRIRPYHGVSPWFLAYCFANDANTGRLETYFTGSTIKHFTGESIRSYPIPLPPINEQQRIVAEVQSSLSLIEASERSIDSNLARAERLRQGVLGKAFRGELVASVETSEVSEDL